MKLNKEICQDQLDVLKQANEQWFNGYHFETSDYLKLVEAVAFFEHIKVKQRNKLIAEGEL